MGFFKNLKEKLFGFNKKDKNESQEINQAKIDVLNENDNKIFDENVSVVEKNLSFTKDENNNINNENNLIKNNDVKNEDNDRKIVLSKIEKKQIKKLERKEKKIQKKEEKDFKKKLIKENKINKYVAGLNKSNLNLTQKIIELQSKHNKIDENFFDELEEILIMSDISIDFVEIILNEVKKEVKKENVNDPKLISEIIADKMFTIYANNSAVDTKLKLDNLGLNILLVVGVNGSGKTTTIAKITKKLLNENKKILLVAADTFRAGAVEQLKIWANRLNVNIICPDKEGADPASVVYKAFEETKKNEYDVMIIDTAGRMQNKINLMNELSKINKIIEKFVPGAPHESLLVLDATTGQNGINQASVFKEVTPISGIVLTKMDGTSNGGIILSIKDKLNLDVKLIGLGEKMDDLEEFDLDAYIYGLMKGLIDYNEQNSR